MEWRMHSGLGGETAALQPWAGEPSSAPLFRGLQQDGQAKTSPQQGSQRGLSSPRDGRHL